MMRRRLGVALAVGGDEGRDLLERGRAVTAPRQHSVDGRHCYLLPYPVGLRTVIAYSFEPQQREHIESLQLGPPVEEPQLQQEPEARDPAAESLDQADRRRRRPAGRRDVVDDEHPVARAARRHGGSRAGPCRTRARTPPARSPTAACRPCGRARARRRTGRRRVRRAGIPGLRHPAPGRSDADAKCSAMASIVQRNASTSLSRGVMSLKPTPGRGQSGMSRISSLRNAASSAIAPC